MIKLVRVAASVVLLSLASVSAHAGLIINAADEITGVDGIIIDGVSRTFDFLDGSFIGFYNGVVPAGNYSTTATDIAAMFSDGTGTSPIDIAQISGCGSFLFCEVLLITGTDDQISTFFGSSIIVRRFGVNVEDFLGSGDAITSGSINSTFAVLRPSSVPEPGTMGLLGLSLLGLGFARKIHHKA